MADRSSPPPPAARDSGPSSDYWAILVSLDPEAADAVANFLVETGAAGVVEEGEGAPVRLRAFFPPGSDAAGIQRRLVEYLDELRALAVAVGPGPVEVTAVPEEAWAEAWRAHFRPLPIGRRLLVCPPWEVPEDGRRGGRLLVLIEPGRAFGTGGHASTRACLELTERALERRPAEHALDVGTGSGILAIAAIRLGVPAVTALDVDPDAVAAAAANAGRNGVADRIGVEIGALEGWSGRPVGLVLANLLGPVLITLAPALARACAVPGWLVAGGLLVHQVPVVVASLVPEGFELVEVAEHEGWAALLLAHAQAAVPRPA
ncbi:MAG TPA: 50S ribosomal protein L11 methyltransferase [Methylomirabilota bacterium]|nr:50S ribosomal protein L11 methyltransferase [Methylomirabilota bacterium]